MGHICINFPALHQNFYHFSGNEKTTIKHCYITNRVLDSNSVADGNEKIDANYTHI